MHLFMKVFRHSQSQLTVCALVFDALGMNLNNPEVLLLQETSAGWLQKLCSKLQTHPVKIQ